MVFQRLSSGSLLSLKLVWMTVLVAALPLGHFVYSVIRWKTYIWLPSYVRSIQHQSDTSVTDVIFVVADHYELGKGAESVHDNRTWIAEYTKLSNRHHDTAGRNLQHSWFLPLEQLQDPVLSDLAEVIQQGYGELEVHWHHSNESPASYEAKLIMGLAKLQEYGAIQDRHGTTSFGYIAGNWALDNSLDPGRKGVANELEILARQGCIADYTFPIIGSDAQPSQVNELYYVTDSPGNKSYDSGKTMSVGGETAGDLLMFTGPIGYTSLLPLYIEYSAFENDPIPSVERVRSLVKLSPVVQGKPEWRFLKVHTHSQQSRDAWFQGPVDQTLTALEEYCSSRTIQLHYVSAREAYNIAKAAEAGKSGNPRQYYDYLVQPPVGKLAVD